MAVIDVAVAKRIREIEREISFIALKDTSLFGGSGGIAIFYYALYQWKNDKRHLNKCQLIVNDLKKKANLLNLDHSMGSGLTGIAWTLDFLFETAAVKVELGSFYSNVDSKIYIQSLRCLMNREYEYLDGALSAPVYALRRLPDEMAFGYLQQFVGIMDYYKIIDERGVRWMNFELSRGGKEAGQQDISFGLARGVVSIINILIRVYKKGIFKDEISRLVSGGLLWLINSRKEISERSKRSVFNDENSSIVWHDGILGMAWTFWRSGQILGNDVWRTEALRVVDDSLNLKLADDFRDLDASLYRGTAGIALFYKRFYEETQNVNYLHRYEFWLQATLDRIDHVHKGRSDDGHSATSANKWENGYGLLTGICGTGLVLIDHLASGAQDWDECLLLAID